MLQSKQVVHDFWNEASCGERLLLSETDYDAQAAERYRLEPYIEELAEFDSWRDKLVLEIGVGLGADHERFAQAGTTLFGIDLTNRAIQHTRARFATKKLECSLMQMDAEQLIFRDNTLDMVYSWGVLHHTPDTAKAIKEVYRVLSPGGEARIMIYHKWSIIGYMLWFRYAFLTGRWRMTLSDIYAQYLESPGTKAYSVDEARKLFSDFSDVHIKTVLTHGDLLTSKAGQRHQGTLLKVARAVWPRVVIKTLLPNHGLFMLIRARK